MPPRASNCSTGCIAVSRPEQGNGIPERQRGKVKMNGLYCGKGIDGDTEHGGKHRRKAGYVPAVVFANSPQRLRFTVFEKRKPDFRRHRSGNVPRPVNAHNARFDSGLRTVRQQALPEPTGRMEQINMAIFRRYHAIH